MTDGSKDIDSGVDPYAADDEQTSPMSFLLTAAGGLLVAIVCFTPLWGEIADPEAGGRRGWFSRMLASIGPMPIAAVALSVAVVALVLMLRARRVAVQSGSELSSKASRVESDKE